MSLFKDRYYEECSFPSLFFGEPRKYVDLCEKSYAKTAKWELMNKDRRFARCIENLFFKTMKIIILKILSSTWVRLRKGQLQGKKIVARDVAEDTNIERILHSKTGFRDFESLRTSPDYKEKLKKNAFAMIRQLGQPSFFYNALVC